MLNAHGGGKIAVAHHMNDQAETIMFNMIRGSGIKGIGGMNPANGDIIRPLLCVKRAEIEEYLSSIGREYCTDSTNLHDDYMRNRLRLKLIPYIEENINANFVENINEMAQILRETDDFMADCTDKIYGDSLIEKEDKKQATGQLDLYNFKLAEIAHELDKVNVNELTPIEALNTLVRIKEEIKE